MWVMVYFILLLQKTNFIITVKIQVCRVSSDGVILHNTVTRYDIIKQEAQSFLVIG